MKASSMIRSIYLIPLVVGLLGCTPSSISTPTIGGGQLQQVPIPSKWAGAITHPDGMTESAILEFTEAGGTFNIQPKTKTFKIEEVEHADAMISFKVAGENEMHFSGSFDGSEITGTVEDDGKTDSFILLPILPESSETLNAFSGTYQFESGESVLINLAPEYDSSGLYFFGQGLMVTHFGTGAIRALYPVAKDSYLVGSARAIGYPFVEQITFQRDSKGNVNGLVWQTRDPISGELGDEQQATRLALKSEIVHFTSEDGTTLTGLLTLPATSVPYPAVMLLHGSEPGTRDNFGSQQMSAFMASQGIAILTYDKRGVGDSEGQYVESATEANLTRTAQDAIAGVEYLKNRPEIIGNKIGLVGSSQAGWVIPLAASLSNDISYFIILSGPVTSVGHEDIYSEYTNDGETPRNYSQDEISSTLASVPHSGFDSTPYIAKLNQPGLWIWGDQDKSQPFFEGVTNLQEIIGQGKSNFSYSVLTNADHNLQQTTQGLFNEIPSSPGYHKDFFKIMIEWLDENIK